MLYLAYFIVKSESGKYFAQQPSIFLACPEVMVTLYRYNLSKNIIPKLEE